MASPPAADLPTPIIAQPFRLRNLRSLESPTAFVFFPVLTTFRNQDRNGLDYHLDRIEGEARLPRGSLRGDSNFEELTPDGGVAVFVAEPT